MNISKRNKILAGLLGITLIVASVIGGFNLTLKDNTAYAKTKGIVGSNTEMRGVWVPTVFNLAYPSKAGLSEAQLKSEADKILNNSKDLGFNVIFFQVRPTGDAFYNSKIFPWSKLLSGQQGVAPAGGFDPLKYFVDGAHSRGMELHAWVNPYRVTSVAKDNSALASNNPAVINPSLTVTHSDGMIYYNPGEPDARKLVIDGVAEIIDNYDVDGIHFDDYFYPGKDFNDNATYAKYGAGFDNIGDFRRNNNDLLITDMKAMMDGKGKNIPLGISPFGVWANKSNNIHGSDTSSNESYYLHYADTRKWVKNEYIDYIMPQIYWEDGHKSADYTTIAKWWSDVVQGTNVKYYVGMAAYKTLNAAAGSPWVGGAEITRQLEYNRSNSSIHGYAMYAYQSIMSDQNLYNVIKSGNNASAGNNGGGETVQPPSHVGAVASDIKVTIDGIPVQFPAYNINDNNYFKLRDIAYALNTTEKKFGVTWDQDKQAINLLNGKPYEAIGGELAKEDGTKVTTGILSTAKIYLDGKEVKLTAYTINDYNYFKLRDIGETFNFATDWNNDTRTITIKTNESYKAE